MKILLVSSGSGSRGGGELFLLHLSHSLVKEGVNVTVLIPSHPRMDELAGKFSPQISIARTTYPNTYFDRPFRSLFSAYDKKTIHRLQSLWQNLTPDIIHINQQTPEDGLDLLCAAKATKIPTLSTIHITQSAAALGARCGRWRDAAARKLLRHFPHSLAAVSDNRGKALRAFTNQKIRVIYNGVPDSPALPFSLKPPHIIGVGRLEPQKNPLRFLQIAADIRKTHPTTKVTWVGDGSLRSEFEKTAHALDINLHLPGWVNDVTPYYIDSTHYIHTAEFEGLPFSIIEALRAGLPCVVNQSIIDEAAPLQTCCLPLESTEWSRVFLDETMRKTLAAQSRHTWEQHFRADAMARSYIDLYCSIS